MPLNSFTRTILLFLVVLLTSSTTSSAKTTSPDYRDQVAVLMYHHIAEDNFSSGTIKPQLLRSQIEYLVKQGYNFISLEEFRAFMNGATVPDNAVFITFDDGYESFYQYAYPEFKRRLIPAVNFVITQHTDVTGKTAIPHLTSGQIKAMAHETNFISLQCHTDSLHYKQKGLHTSALSGPIVVNGKLESEAAYAKRIRSDLLTCTDQMGRLSGERQDSFAYPYGLSSSTAINVLKEIGVRYAFTTRAGMATRDTDAMLIPRINAGNPNITPQDLHQSIQQHRTKAKPVIVEADLVEAFKQIGASIQISPKGAIQAVYGRDQFQMQAGSKSAIKNNQKMKLQTAVRKKNNRLFIRFDDLQRLLDVELVYSPSGHYSVREPLTAIGQSISTSH